MDCCVIISYQAAREKDERGRETETGSGRACKTNKLTKY